MKNAAQKTLALVLTLALALVPVLGMAATTVQQDFRDKYENTQDYHFYEAQFYSESLIMLQPRESLNFGKPIIRFPHIDGGFLLNEDGLFVCTNSDDMTILPSEEVEVYAVCLGVVVMRNGGQLDIPTQVQYRVNGGPVQTYTTKENPEDNALVIESYSPIRSIVLLGTDPPQFNGVSYMLASDQPPRTPIQGIETPQDEGAQGEETEGAAQSSGSYEVTASRLNIRWGRGTDFLRVGQLKQGERVQVTDIKDGWGKIPFGMTWAYVSMDYLKAV